MNYKHIDETISVSAQIEATEIGSIIAAGFKSIICNRPDDEEPGQPGHAQIEAAAKAAGVPFRNIPVVSGRITQENVLDMKEALDALPKPVFAYCRSGARCANLYALVQDFEG